MVIKVIKKRIHFTNLYRLLKGLSSSNKAKKISFLPFRFPIKPKRLKIKALTIGLVLYSMYPKYNKKNNLD